MPYLRSCLLLFLLINGYLFTYCQIKLPGFISDGMILQHNTQTKLWGWASPNKKTLSFNGKQYPATASNNGKEGSLWNDSVTDTLYVKYAWEENSEGANLYNKEALPASPFEVAEQ